MLANPLTYIELVNKKITDIPIKKGQVINDTLNKKIYVDSYNMGRMITTKIVVTDIFDEVGLVDKLYYKPIDSKFYVFNLTSSSYTEVEYLTEVIHIIEPVSVYKGATLILDSENESHELVPTNMAPVSLTNLIYRPSGENLEVYLRGLANEVADSGMYKVVIVDANTSHPLPIPVPHDRWFANGGTMGVYVDGVFIPSDKYDIKLPDNTIEFDDYPEGLPTDSKVEFAFYDTLDNMSIKKNRFISTKNQTVFNLDFTYTLGLNSVEVYVNGIKQPNECYEETNANTITLNGIIPERSEVVIQAGKLVPSTPEFYEDFETRSITWESDTLRVTKYPKDKVGRIRSLEETFDSNNRVILRVAKINDIEVKRETLVYKDDGSVVITVS